jgi:hypothetical protein
LILVDTSIMIDTLRGVPAAREAISAAAAAEHQVVASVVSKVELLSGLRAHEKRATRELMAAIAWVAVADETGEEAGGYARTHRRSDHGIGVVDVIIAATVTRLGAQLWTHHVRHCPMFPDLAAPY